MKFYTQHNKKGIDYIQPSFELLEKKLKDMPKADHHKGLIEFEHNQHKFLLNWLYSHSAGYKHAFPEGVPKEHEDHFSNKMYEDTHEGDEHDV